MTLLIKKALLVLTAYVYVWVRGKANRAPSSLNSVAVVQMAKLGDMVCTTPVFRAIREKYPAARITVFGNRVNKNLLEHNPDVDVYVSFPGLFAFAKLLRRSSFDAIVIAGPDFSSLAVAFLSGQRCIIAPRVTGGESPLCDRWYRGLLPLVIERPHAMGSYAPREYLRLLEPLGIVTEITHKHLAYSHSARSRITQFLETEGLRKGALLVGILPAAGNKVKEWPIERFAEVALALRERNAYVLLIGATSDTVRAQAILEKAGDVEIRNVCGKFSLDESKALIDSLDLVVGVDTGPIYIAEAFGTPTVDIVGPMDEHEQPPIGEHHVVLVPKEPRIPQMHIMNAHPRDEREARRQVESISVDEVIRACLSLLEKKL